MALTQAYKVENALHDNNARAKNNGNCELISTEIVHIDTTGDQRDDQTGKALTQQLPLAVNGVDFTGALDEAVLNGSVDVAVHSLKDIPPDCRWKVGENKNLVIGAYFGPRATPLDLLITKEGCIDSIEKLPQGAKVGSASIRRQAQLKAVRPDLNVINIRGNVDTRLRALENGKIEALILALAGLKRLGIYDEKDKISNDPDISGIEERKEKFKYHYNPIPIETMLPGLGQGIIAITCRHDNAAILSLLDEVDDHQSRIAATTERTFLDTVQSLSPWVGRPPVAGFMRPFDNSWLFNGLLATPDGAQVLRVQNIIENERCTEEAAQELGRMAGDELAQLAGDDFLDGFY